MKLLFASIVLLFGMTATAQTQQHGIDLTWTENDPNFPTVTFNVYRLIGTCPVAGSGITTFTKVNTAAVATTTYFDPNPTPIGQNANLCYAVTANANGLESAPSPYAPVVFLPPPFPPTGPSATVK